MAEASDSGTVYRRQRRIAQLAKQMPEKGLTYLNQHLDLEWLREAYRRLRKDGAVGIDGQTAADYERDLEGNLRSLLERAKSGAYWAPPVRRVHIPKGTGGETRPIGIPTHPIRLSAPACDVIARPSHDPRSGRSSPICVRTATPLVRLTLTPPAGCAPAASVAAVSDISPPA